jgi:uncharacterized protein
MEIEWGPSKAASNLKKHGIHFSDTEPAFYDDCALCMPDPFAIREERFLLIGTDAVGRILAISYTYRGETVRLISARRATASERSDYEKGIRF